MVISVAAGQKVVKAVTVSVTTTTLPGSAEVAVVEAGGSELLEVWLLEEPKVEVTLVPGSTPVVLDVIGPELPLEVVAVPGMSVSVSQSSSSVVVVEVIPVTVSVTEVVDAIVDEELSLETVEAEEISLETVEVEENVSLDTVEVEEEVSVSVSVSQSSSSVDVGDCVELVEPESVVLTPGAEVIVDVSALSDDVTETVIELVVESSLDTVEEEEVSVSVSVSQSSSSVEVGDGVELIEPESVLLALGVEVIVDVSALPDDATETGAELVVELSLPEDALEMLAELVAEVESLLIEVGASAVVVVGAGVAVALGVAEVEVSELEELSVVVAVLKDETEVDDAMVRS